MGKKIKTIDWKTYIIPLGVIVFLFAIAGHVLTNSISSFIFQHRIEDSNRLANNHMSRLYNSVNAMSTIDELLSNKLTVATNIVLKNRDKLSNSFLEEMATELKVDQIYWYNSTGEIIYTNADYLGWQAREGHPAYNFMENYKYMLVEDIRGDTESGIYYKYAYSKDRDGEFVQVGILANNIQELTYKFSPQNFIDTLVDNEDILHIHILDNELKVIFSSNETENMYYNLDSSARTAIEEDKTYYAKDHIGNIDVYRTLFPIYVDNMKMGTLVIIYSLEPVNDLIKKIALMAICLLFLAFGVYGAMIIAIIIKNKKIEKIAYHDPVTNFLNKNYFMEFLEEQLRTKAENKGALLLVNCINLNLIKLISGYRALDDMLFEKANQLRKLNIKHEYLFKYSEDAFFIYVDSYKDKDQLIDLCNEILDLFENIIKSLKTSKLISTKIGVLEIIADYSNVDDVIRDAEITIKELEQLRDKKYCFFDESMKEDLILNEMIERELRRATYDGYTQEFYLEYQPQVDLRTNEIIGLEALARWRSKELGLIPPAKFIDVAEKYQLIIPLGEWILTTACKFIKELEDKGLGGIKVAVNISVIQLLQDGFVNNLMEIIEKSKIKPQDLELEITETKLMNNYGIINKKLEILKNKGISISLDDFGTGYSSLSRLKNLNIDVIKIDKSFIDNIVEPDKEDVFVKGIITIAKQLQLKTVAEGVELEDQKEYLLAQDCDMMQGYLFSRPISRAAAIDLLNTGKSSLQPAIR